MASELRVNTLKDASGNNSVATSFVAGGSAKAWVNMNGTGTIAIRGNLNVSGLTDVGTGKYTTAFSSNLSSINYSLVLSADGVHNGVVTSIGHGDSDNDGLQTSLARIETRGGDGSGSGLDATIVTTAVFGDLA